MSPFGQHCDTLVESMGRIRILPDHVANQIAAGEVVDRPASVVKELLENSLDAGATRIRVEIEAGGRRLIRILDNGCGMNRDDALLAFERHATSKLRTADELLSIATLGFRGEALPSIASVSRLTLETAANEFPAAEQTTTRPVGTRIEIAGGKILAVEDAALPAGACFTIRDLFFNTPARRKFLRAESTETAHITALVTHYALAHPDKYFELISSSHTLLQAPPVLRTEERIFQVFGAETLSHLLPVAAESALDRSGLPEPPPWKIVPEEQALRREPGHIRLSGFYSRPELQKLNRNSIYLFVNRRLIRDRMLLHAVSEAYRNILPPTSYPVALLFLEMPPEEVDVNVHPAKTEVRFRQQTLVHDFLRDSLRAALVQSRPAAGFLAALDSSASSLLPTAASHLPGPSDLPLQPVGNGLPPGDPAYASEAADPEQDPAQPFPVQPLSAQPHSADSASGFRLAAPSLPAVPRNLPFPAALADALPALLGSSQPPATLHGLATLRPLGQLRNSFILAVNDEGLWIIDQHVAHERVLFEKILASRDVEAVQRQRLLMPVLVELQPWQMVIFAAIAEELDRNGFEAQPFGPRTIAIHAAPIGLEGGQMQRMLMEVIEQTGGLDRDNTADAPLPRRDLPADLRTIRGRVAASIACHSAIKINTPLEPQKMAWLLEELSKTAHPTSCPHGRPITLRYSWIEIQRAFQRI